MSSMRRRQGAGPISEDDVHVIVDNAFEKYEREVAKPRHEQNSNKMDHNSNKLDELLEVNAQIKGGVTAIKYTMYWLGGAASAFWAVFKVVQEIRGH